MTIKLHESNSIIQDRNENVWYISFTSSRSNEDLWFAWATRKPAPRNADVITMLKIPGEVHSAMGTTPAEARDRLERELGNLDLAEALNHRVKSRRPNTTFTNIMAYVLLIGLVAIVSALAASAIVWAIRFIL